MPRDTLFSQEQKPLPPFEFNEQVAQVFDDMIGRSVPLYRETLRRQAALAAHFYQPGSRIYDLGCSNGNFGLVLLQAMGSRSFEMRAVDSSAAMIAAFRKRLAPLDGGTRIHPQEADIRRLSMEDPSVVVLNLTLQFLPPAQRDGLIAGIHSALRPGGVLLMTEKTVHADLELGGLEQRFYYDFKRENGYSELEISQKREALENVLVPETVENHFNRLGRAGFRRIDLWLKWFNFASWLAVKE
jgi:tRNA (cmo5U34)-methyltransferase